MSSMASSLASLELPKFFNESRPKENLLSDEEEDEDGLKEEERSSETVDEEKTNDEESVLLQIPEDEASYGDLNNVETAYPLSSLDDVDVMSRNSTHPLMTSSSQQESESIEKKSDSTDILEAVNFESHESPMATTDPSIVPTATSNDTRKFTATEINETVSIVLTDTSNDAHKFTATEINETNASTSDVMHYEDTEEDEVFLDELLETAVSNVLARPSTGYHLEDDLKAVVAEVDVQLSNISTWHEESNETKHDETIPAARSTVPPEQLQESTFSIGASLPKIVTEEYLAPEKSKLRPFSFAKDKEKLPLLENVSDVQNSKSKQKRGKLKKKTTIKREKKSKKLKAHAPIYEKKEKIPQYRALLHDSPSGGISVDSTNVRSSADIITSTRVEIVKHKEEDIRVGVAVIERLPSISEEPEAMMGLSKKELRAAAKREKVERKRRAVEKSRLEELEKLKRRENLENEFKEEQLKKEEEKLAKLLAEEERQREMERDIEEQKLREAEEKTRAEAEKEKARRKMEALLVERRAEVEFKRAQEKLMAEIQADLLQKEQEMLARLNEEERIQYEKQKAEEESERLQEEEERRRMKLFKQQIEEAERKRVLEELEEYHLQLLKKHFFHTGLWRSNWKLELNQKLSRAFTYSYNEMLPFILYRSAVIKTDLTDGNDSSLPELSDLLDSLDVV